MIGAEQLVGGHTIGSHWTLPRWQLGTEDTLMSSTMFVFRIILSPANLTLLVGRLPPVTVLKECSLVGALLLHVLDQLLVPDLLPEVPQVAGDDLQVIPGVPRQAGLGRVDTVQSSLDTII